MHEVFLLVFPYLCAYFSFQTQCSLGILLFEYLTLKKAKKYRSTASYFLNLSNYFLNRCLTENCGDTGTQVLHLHIGFVCKFFLFYFLLTVEILCVKYCNT